MDWQFLSPCDIHIRRIITKILNFAKNSRILTFCQPKIIPKLENYAEKNWKVSWRKNAQHHSTYQQTFYNVLGVDQENATDKEKLNFFESHFTIIEKKLTHKNSRKIFEGMLICLNKPTLNKQKEHKILKFLCTCFLNKSNNTAIT